MYKSCDILELCTHCNWQYRNEYIGQRSINMCKVSDNRIMRHEKEDFTVQVTIMQSGNDKIRVGFVCGNGGGVCGVGRSVVVTYLAGETLSSYIVDSSSPSIPRWSLAFFCEKITTSTIVFTYVFSVVTRSMHASVLYDIVLFSAKKSYHVQS